MDQKSQILNAVQARLEQLSDCDLTGHDLQAPGLSQTELLDQVKQQGMERQIAEDFQVDGMLRIMTHIQESESAFVNRVLESVELDSYGKPGTCGDLKPPAIPIQYAAEERGWPTLLDEFSEGRADYVGKEIRIREKTDQPPRVPTRRRFERTSRQKNNGTSAYRSEFRCWWLPGSFLLLAKEWNADLSRRATGRTPRRSSYLESRTA